MASSLSNIAGKDGTTTTIAGGILAVDKSGAGTGPFIPANVLVDTQGVNTATVKAATTAVASGDTALAVGLHPTSPLPAGTNVIGHVIVDTAPSTPVTNAGTFAVQVSNANPDGQTTMANSAPVVIASDQTVIPTKLQPATSGGLSRTRTLIPNNTTNVIIKVSAGQVYKIRATNNSANIAYIKLYDAATATAGAGTPVDTIMIPAATAGGAGVVDTTDIGVAHATGITFIVTTGIADTDTTAPAASAYIVTIYYK